MLQIVLDEPGTFSSREISEPTPQAGEALVKVHRIGVCGTDLHAFNGRQPFFEYPRVLGHELGVEIVSIGENDLGLKVGDRCSIEPYNYCGECIACRRGKTNCCKSMSVIGIHSDGGMSPLMTIPAEKLLVANDLSYDQLALVETLGIGAHAVERGAPKQDETVLVIGAGPIGLGTIQFAQAAGANVIVMDISDDRLDFCRNTLGVKHGINPQNGAPIDQLLELNDGELPTIVFDATGHPASMQSTFELVDHGGKIVFVGLFIGEVKFDDPNFHKRELTLMSSRNATTETLKNVLELIRAGKIDTDPWVNHRLGLTEIVDQFSEIHKQPNVVKSMIDVS